MEVFIIFLAYSTFVTILYPFYKKTRITCLLRWIGNAYLILILGFRGLEVGIDTYSYYEYYMRDLDWDEIGEYYHYMGMLYWYFSKLVSEVWGEYQIILFLTAFLNIYLINRFIVKESPYPMLSYFIYVSFGFYAVAFNLLRQYIAISFILIVLVNLIEGKKKNAWLIYVISFLVHQSVIIFFPVFLVYKCDINKKVILIYAGLCGLVLVLFKYVISIMADLFFGGAYIDFINQEGGGGITFSIYFIVLIVSLIFKKYILSNSKKNLIYIHVTCMAVLVQSTAFLFPLTSRAAYVFSLCFIAYIPILIHAIPNVYVRVISIFSLMTLGWVAYLTKFYNLAGIYPYKFFFE